MRLHNEFRLACLNKQMNNKVSILSYGFIYSPRGLRQSLYWELSDAFLMI